MNIVILITIITFLGSIIRVISGLGGGTLLVTSLVYFLPLDQTIVLTAIIHWFNAILIVVFFWKGLKKRFLMMFAFPGVITAFLGSYILANTDSEWLLSYLGVVIISYALFVWLDPKFRVRQKPIALVVGGGLSGFFKSIFGVGGGINAAVLSAFDLSKASYLATGAAVSFVLDSARLIGYWWHGIMLPFYLQTGFFLFIPSTLVGSLLGRYIVTWVPQKYFRTTVLVFIFIMGVYFLARSYI